MSTTAAQADLPSVHQVAMTRPLAWLALGMLIFGACLVGIFARPIGFLSAFWRPRWA